MGWKQAVCVQDDNWTAVEVLHGAGQGPFVLVCEHAARHIPAGLNNLGLQEPALSAHIAWDIGALDVAREMSVLLDAPLVAGRISRLVYDCNRPPTAPDCIPLRSEVFDIPGNTALDDQTRLQRHDSVHLPFHTRLGAVIEAQMERCDSAPMLVTVHSFTSVYNGAPRAVEIGFLCHGDAKLADAALAVEQQIGRHNAGLNQPYGRQDGVTHTLATQGEARGLPSVMLEVRNDLINSPGSARKMAQHLSAVLMQASERLAARAAG